MRGDSPKASRRHTPRSDRFEMEARLRNIEERLRMGLTPAEVIIELSSPHNRLCQANPEAPCTRHLGISTRQAKAYLSKVYDRFREASGAHEAVMRDQLVALQFRCYQGAFARQDFTGASRILMHIARITGLVEGAPPQQVVQLLGNLPSDRDRFPADTNYQAQALLRDALLAQAARGNKKAAELAATIAATLTDQYGAARSGLTSDVEESIVAKVRAHLVTEAHLPGGPLEPIERRDSEGRLLPAIDDFANLETVKQDKPEGAR
jgi:hypothetical protein